MQIDVLSQNTLKLTLSRLDMFDMDIKYESLSGKNPDTKRLLSHVLRTVRLDKSSEVDFSGERLFVEAFPRPDGGCMLYISNLESSDYSQEKKPIRLNHRIPPAFEKSDNRSKYSGYELLCSFGSIRELEKACKSLAWQLSSDRVNSVNRTDRAGCESSLWCGYGNEYRLYLSGSVKYDRGLFQAIVSEYGELLNSQQELPVTQEYYNMIIGENAVEKINELA